MRSYALRCVWNISRRYQSLSTLKLRSIDRVTSARMASTFPTFPNLAIFRALSCHEPQSTAIVHSRSGRTFTYGGLLYDVGNSKAKLQETLKGAVNNGQPTAGQRVAFLVENSYDYVVTLLSIFACDAIAVPLSASFPASELQYVLEDSQAVVLLSSQTCHHKAEEILANYPAQKPILKIVQNHSGRESDGEDPVLLSPLPAPKGGMMLYTSGTTSRPKGVVLGASTLAAQVESLQEAWKYSPKDRLLHLLPLHHIHGTINALLTPLVSGSTIEFMFPFNADAVWERLAAPFVSSNGTSALGKPPITFLTVVPTIYNRFISTHGSLPPNIQSALKQALSPRTMRLNISGSAALPTPTKKAWEDLSGGNILLERYGMTEAGMALSCGLDFADRVDGSVGWPLPKVEVRLVDSETGQVIPTGEELDHTTGKEKEGEIQLRGPTIFKEYWRNPKATEEEFVDSTNGKGKWFKTGDIATRRTIPGAGVGQDKWARGPMYFIRGRRSTDIIKSGGEKVSALEIERELLSLPQITDAAVVGVANEQWGQKVSAVVVLDPSQRMSGKGGKQWGVMDMRRALKDALAAYKIPQELRFVDELPKNAMGKVNKKALAKEIFGPDA